MHVHACTHTLVISDLQAKDRARDRAERIRDLNLARESEERSRCPAIDTPQKSPHALQLQSAASLHTSNSSGQLKMAQQRSIGPPVIGILHAHTASSTPMPVCAIFVAI